MIEALPLGLAAWFSSGVFASALSATGSAVAGHNRAQAEMRRAKLAHSAQNAQPTKSTPANSGPISALETLKIDHQTTLDKADS